MTERSVHPLVSDTKFERELSQFNDQGRRMRERGVLLLDATPPSVLIAFVAPQLRPASIVITVRIDYRDYDLQPPSVVFVDPFTDEALRLDQLHTQMLRGVEQQVQMASPDGLQAGLTLPTMVIQQPLIQAHDTGLPFLCLPGVREYHNHPGHSGDPWELHRTTGAGSLVRLVETIRKYAVEPIADWGVNLIPQVGFASAGAPPL